MLLRKGLIPAGGGGQNNDSLQFYGSWGEYTIPLFGTHCQATGLAHRQFNCGNTDSVMLKDRADNI